MKKRLSVLLCAALVASMFVGCGSKAPADDASSDNAAAGPLAGKKVAVVRNLANGDHTQQFLAGCVEEGEKMGMTVDTFVTDGDDAKMSGNSSSSYF